MKNVIVIGVCLAIATTGAMRSFGQKPDAPRFEDYSAAVWRGKVAPLNLRSHPLARKFRTLFSQQLREERVNFAGHYAFVSAGCGTGCSLSGIIDARNGRAYFPSELSGWTSIVGDYEGPEVEEPWVYRAESRLLRTIGRPRIGGVTEERYGPSGIYFYEWTNNRLRQVKFIPVGSYPTADPPEKP